MEHTDPQGAVDIRILGFETRSEMREDGSVKQYDVVSWCQPGAADRTVVVKRVDKYLRAKPDRPVPFGIRQVIEPAYKAWKAGHELPEDGTPLDVWPGLNPDQAKILRNHGINTVEKVKDIHENEIHKVPLPGLRALKEMAARFLANRDQASVTTALKEKDGEIAELRSQIEELTALMAPKEGEEPVKRGPGRPRKNPEA